jgi:hypothetical protein
VARAGHAPHGRPFADRALPRRPGRGDGHRGCGGGGQNWTRLYARRAGFPQIIHSAKRFAGPTGLEEYVGCGVGMALTVHVEEHALIFRSAGYFLELFGRRVPLPAWLSVGALTGTHGELGEGRFSFTLDLVHPRFGALIRQTAEFREAGP